MLELGSSELTVPDWLLFPFCYELVITVSAVGSQRGKRCQAELTFMIDCFVSLGYFGPKEGKGREVRPTLLSARDALGPSVEREQVLFGFRAFLFPLSLAIPGQRS